jgi:hypothetical protein
MHLRSIGVAWELRLLIWHDSEACGQQEVIEKGTPTMKHLLCVVLGVMKREAVSEEEERHRADHRA